MGEIRSVGAGKRKGPLLSSGLVLSRISAPISTLAAFERVFCLMPMRSANSACVISKPRIPGCGDPPHSRQFIAG